MIQDLLNEDDFLKKPYNPWKRFILFYGIEIAATVLLFMLTAYSPIPAVISILCLPIFLASMMIFYKKAYLVINDKLVIRSVSGLFLLYCLPLSIVAIMTYISERTFAILILLLILTIIYGLTLLIIIAISREERRNAHKASIQEMKDN